MKNFIASALSVLFACACAFAQGSSAKTVQSTGFGKTPAAAEEDAVIRAVKSATGMQIAVNEQSVSHTVESTHSVSAGGKEVASEKFGISDELKKSLATRAQGRIKGYDVLARQFNDETGQWEVSVAVEVFGQYVLGRNPDRLRRMFVADFSPVNAASVPFYGSSWTSFAPADRFRLSAEDVLTATRKFTMLDRRNDTVVNMELGRAGDANFSTSDLCRLGNKLMTDYVVTGQIEFFAPPAPYKDKFTSREIVPDGPVAKIHYRVILVPTQQLKCSGSVTVSVSELSGSTVAELASAAMERGAEKAVAKIMEGILPFRIAQIAGDAIVVNQGGDTLHLGECFGVYAQGDVITDPATGEVIDRVEIPVGEVKITRITPKLSYAEVCRGKLEDMKAGCVLRRYTQEENDAAEEAAENSGRETPVFNGKLPFDK